MTNKKVLVLGGKGKTGRKVAERLTKLGQVVRIGSRGEQPSFDWENSETWAGAMEGMDAVYITFQPDLAVPGAPDAIKEFTALAVKSGVKKMVLLSGRGEPEAQACEQIVMSAAVDWTVVRASWFSQNFSESFLLDPILAGHVALPRSETLEPFIDTDDIAEVAVEALLHEKHSGQLYELTGPRLMTFRDAVKEISEAVGREIQFHPIGMDEYEAMLKEHQVPADYIWLVKYLFTQVLDGRNESTTNGVEMVLGRKAKDFREYAMETAKKGVWTVDELIETK